MEVLIQTHQTETQAWRELAEGRLRSASQRQGGWLSRVVVRLRDVNGPRGGVDKQCQIQLHTAKGGVLVVSSRAASWRSALERAISRAMHSLARWIDIRKQPHPKTRRGAPGPLPGRNHPA